MPRSSTAPATRRFTPKPVHVVESPEQLKAFTDPLRNQVLAVFVAREATNQQVAERLGESQAKVLYHLRVLLGCELIRLVGTRVKGGNVEKYYRATARLFSLRPGPDQFPALIDAGLETLRQEVAASTTLWPEQPRWFESRSRRIPAARAKEFRERMARLIEEYWDADEDPQAPLLGLAALIYRDPTDPTGGE